MVTLVVFWHDVFVTAASPELKALINYEILADFIICFFLQDLPLVSVNEHFHVDATIFVSEFVGSGTHARFRDCRDFKDWLNCPRCPIIRPYPNLDTVCLFVEANYIFWG